MQDASSQPFEQQLEAYSATSKSIACDSNWRDRLGNWPLYAAATASALACSTSASASIIYSGPVNVSVSVPPGSASVFNAISVRRPPFFFGMYVTHSSSGGALVRGFAGLEASHINFFNSGSAIKRFASGAAISSRAGSSRFPSRGFLWGNSFGSQFGNWGPANQTGFAGFLFQASSTISGARSFDYGWLRLSVQDLNADGFPDKITVLDAAYNNVPNQPINAGQGAVPEPSTKAMMLLAAGFAGVLAWRRCKAAASPLTEKSS